MRLNNEVFVPIEEIRVEFEKRNTVPDYAAWNVKSDNYRWKKWPGVICPDINDKWEAFVEGWESCLEFQQLPNQN